MATGTWATCGQEDVPLVRRRWLRDHLVNPEDPMSARCPGRSPVELPPPRLPDVPARRKRKKSEKPPRPFDPRLADPDLSTLPADIERSRGDRTVSGGGFESNRRRH